jgi:glutamate-5-semialdehyde dehydrogenase
MSIREYVENIAKATKKASRILASANPKIKNQVLESLIVLLEQNRDEIKKENEKDFKAGKDKGLNSALLDRLALNDKRIDAMIQGVKTIISLPDPVGMIDEQYTLENGLDVGKIRVPIGTIGIIYESRPNVTIDAAALCLKSGNASILRGGSEAFYSNTILVSLVRKALSQNSLPEDCVNFFDRTDRQCVNEMLKLPEYLDLIVPRGGSALIKMVSENSHIPVVKHDKGVCTLYVCSDAQKNNAMDIAVNAKTQRPGVCNAIENIIFDKDCDFIYDVLKALHDNQVEIRGDDKIQEIFADAKPASVEDWSTEYLDLIISAKVVEGIDEAISFINDFGSHHSDSILTADYLRARTFLKNVDSAAVYANASTRFTDGQEFGLGAEIGISTNKIHARGPMGLKELTTVKWIIQGEGQIRD